MGPRKEGVPPHLPRIFYVTRVVSHLCIFGAAMTHKDVCFKLIFIWVSEVVIRGGGCGWRQQGVDPPEKPTSSDILCTGPY